MGAQIPPPPPPLGACGELRPSPPVATSAVVPAPYTRCRCLLDPGDRGLPALSGCFDPGPGHRSPLNNHCSGPHGIQAAGGHTYVRPRGWIGLARVTKNQLYPRQPPGCAWGMAPPDKPRTALLPLADHPKQVLRVCLLWCSRHLFFLREAPGAHGATLDHGEPAAPWQRPRGRLAWHRALRESRRPLPLFSVGRAAFTDALRVRARRPGGDGLPCRSPPKRQCLHSHRSGQDARRPFRDPPAGAGPDNV